VSCYALCEFTAFRAARSFRTYQLSYKFFVMQASLVAVMITASYSQTGYDLARASGVLGVLFGGGSSGKSALDAGANVLMPIISNGGAASAWLSLFLLVYVSVSAALPPLGRSFRRFLS
jgi:hypothetical protein